MVVILESDDERIYLNNLYDVVPESTVFIKKYYFEEFDFFISRLFLSFRKENDFNG